MTIQELEDQIAQADKDKFTARRAEINAQMEALQKELKGCYARVADVVVVTKSGSQYKLGGGLTWDGRRYDYPYKFYTVMDSTNSKRTANVHKGLEVISFKKNF